MGRLLDGEWITHDLGPDAHGRYVRRETRFRDRIRADGSTPFEPEAGRYHLFVSRACGWSHRVLLARRLKGLEHAISASFADPFMGEQGWAFAHEAKLGVTHLHEVYVRARPDYTGRASVPVLWDSATGTIVSNDSLDIVTMLDREFDALATSPEPRWFPSDLEEGVRAMIDANYGPVNNGVYRAGFAGNQAAHAEAVTELFDRLDTLERHLSTHRYLLGDRITAADWCLFTTLFRFDAVYYLHFKCNLRHLWDYPELWAYTRALYQHPGVRETCHLDECKEHYYTSHESISPRRLVPLGPMIDFDAPHHRSAP